MAKSPICGSCQRRAYSLERCLYKADNARSASNDEYLKVLHKRIRELEQACLSAGVVIPTTSSEQMDSDYPTSQLPVDCQDLEAHTARRRLNSGSEGAAAFSRAWDYLGVAKETVGSTVRPITRSVHNPTMLASPGPLTPHPPSATHDQGDRTNSEPERPAAAPIYKGAAAQDALEPTIQNNSRLAARDASTRHPRFRNAGGIQNDFLLGSPLHDDDSPGSSSAQGEVTAMGAISVVEENEIETMPGAQYYGSSSAACFMRLVCESMPRTVDTNRSRSVDDPVSRAGPNQVALDAEPHVWREYCKPSTRFRYEDFSLPPRLLADHLLQCYWDRVHCLYPFIHRPSFESAYQRLWASSKEVQDGSTKLNIGLGSSSDSGRLSIVFNCALNCMFALGCHFSNLAPENQEAVAHSFFLRAKQLIGLELLESGTIGVVQTLLVVALYLQSTPHPKRCWNCIGVACRVAQGIGLHTDIGQDSRDPLEKEVWRRTWHGCVMMDMVVSMTYGRPSMTSHLPDVPLPRTDCDSDLAVTDLHTPELGGPSLMAFYVSTIKLYKILDKILCDIYEAWCSGPSRNALGTAKRMKSGDLGIIIELDTELRAYEAGLPLFLSWTSGGQAPQDLDRTNIALFERQRNVLHARFLHLRLLLYRPMFGQFYIERTNGPSAVIGSDSTGSYLTGLEKNIFYTSFLAKCAKACVTAAIDLVSLIHGNYQTAATDAWWYNGFCMVTPLFTSKPSAHNFQDTSSASIVLIMSRSCQPLLDELDVTEVDEAWRNCIEILHHMASFSLSARNTLTFLKATYNRLASCGSVPQQNSGETTAAAGLQHGTSQLANHDRTSGYHGDDNHKADSDPTEPELADPTSSSLLNWDEVMDFAPNDLVFLGALDFSESSGLFPDASGWRWNDVG